MRRLSCEQIGNTNRIGNADTCTGRDRYGDAGVTDTIDCRRAER